MKKLTFILLGFWMLTSIEVIAQTNVTMMTYNIEGHSNNDTKTANIAKIINSVQPDVVSVQEVDKRPFVLQHDYLKDIADATGMYYEFLPTVSNSYGIGLLSRTKPLSVQTKIIPLSDSSKDKENRGMIIAEFPDYFFIATHYSLNADDRDTATKYILDFTNESSKTVFVAGDFNAQPTYRAMVTFKNYGYVILNNTGTYTFPSDNPTSCIDMIISYSDFPEAMKYRVISSGIVKDSGVNLVNTSDHLPVYVKLRSIPTTGIDNSTSSTIGITSEGRGIKVSGIDRPSLFSLYNLEGNLLKQIRIETDCMVQLPSFIEKGVYIANLKNEKINHSIKLMFNN